MNGISSRYCNEVVFLVCLYFLKFFLLLKYVLFEVLDFAAI